MALPIAESPLLAGAALGFSIAAPVGPIGVLCVRRTLADGRLVGLATGLGAAAADGVYGLLAALGLTAVTSALVGAARTIGAVGGLMLLAIGLRTMFARPAERAAGASGTGVPAAFGSTFALTLSNPMTIVSFVAVFAGLGIGAVRGRPLAAASMVAGVILGSALWWFLLSGMVSLLRSRFDARAMQIVNRVSGGVVMAFGLVALFGAARGAR